MGTKRSKEPGRERRGIKERIKTKIGGNIRLMKSTAGGRGLEHPRGKSGRRKLVGEMPMTQMVRR
jgi:hypothetical protein